MFKPKRPPPHLIGYRHIFFLTDWEIIMLSMNALLLVVFAVYLTVFLNVLFTSKYFTTANYVCYETGLYMGLGSVWTDQLYPDWWVFLSDMFYALFPIFEIFILVLYRKASNSTFNSLTNAHYAFLGTTFFVKFLTLLIRVYQTLFCYYYNFCRICDDSCQPKFNCSPNTLWIMVVSFNAFYVVMIFFYGIIAVSGFYQENMRDYQYRIIYNLQLNETYAKYGLPFDNVAKSNYLVNDDVQPSSIRGNLVSFYNDTLRYPKKFLKNKKND